MGLILDLAVVALALVVIGSLAILAWTLAVSAVSATRQGRDRVAGMRQTVADAEARLPETMARADAALAEALARTDRSGVPAETPEERREVTRETR